MIPDSRMLLVVLIVAATVMTPARADRNSSSEWSSSDALRTAGGRPMGSRWKMDEGSGDARHCVRGTFAAMRASGRLQRAKIGSETTVLGQSDITTVMGWCIPVGAKSWLFTVVVGPDSGERRRFDSLAGDARRMAGASLPEPPSFELSKFNGTPGRMAGERAPTVATSADERRPSALETCVMHAQNAMRTLRLKSIQARDGVVTASGPDGLAYVVCVRDGSGGAIIKFATFGYEQKKIEDLQARVKDLTLGKPGTATDSRMRNRR